MHIAFTRAGTVGDTEMESEMEDEGQILLQITLYRALVQAVDAGSPRPEKQDELKPGNLRTLKRNRFFLKLC